jgi:hypothetical protein
LNLQPRALSPAGIALAGVEMVVFHAARLDGGSRRAGALEKQLEENVSFPFVHLPA